MKDTKTNCSDVSDRLSLFVGGDLDTEALEIVRAHLVGCGTCAREAAAAARSREAFRAGLSASLTDTQTGSEPAMDLGLWSGVRASLVAEGILATDSVQEHDEVPASGTTPRFVLLRRASQYAAAAAILITGLVVGPKLMESSTGGVAPIANLTPALDENQSAVLPQLSVAGLVGADTGEGALRQRLRSEETLTDRAVPLRFSTLLSPTASGANSLASFGGSSPKVFTKRRLR